MSRRGNANDADDRYGQIVVKLVAVAAGSYRRCREDKTASKDVSLQHEILH